MRHDGGLLFVRDRQAVGKVSLVRRLRLGHEFSDFGLQLRLNRARMLVRKRAVLARVGVDLRADNLGTFYRINL